MGGRFTGFIKDGLPNASETHPFWVSEDEGNHFVRVGVQKSLNGLQEVKDCATIEEATSCRRRKDKRQSQLTWAS